MVGFQKISMSIFYFYWLSVTENHDKLIFRIIFFVGFSLILLFCSDFKNLIFALIALNDVDGSCVIYLNHSWIMFFAIILSYWYYTASFNASLQSRTAYGRFALNIHFEHNYSTSEILFCVTYGISSKKTLKMSPHYCYLLHSFYRLLSGLSFRLKFYLKKLHLFQLHAHPNQFPLRVLPIIL